MIKGMIPNVYFHSDISKASTGMYYERDGYNCFDLIGDLGGVQQVIVVFIGILCIPYSQFAYNLKMSKHLFKARTRDSKMFLKGMKEKHSSDHHMTENMK